MSASFRNTQRSLEEERPRRRLVRASLAVALAAAWGAWFFGARVTLRETSEKARLETERRPHAVDAPVSGMVVEHTLSLGAEVRAGDVLLRLDARKEESALAEEKTRLEASTPEIAALRRVVEAKEKTFELDRDATRAAVGEGEARRKQAEITLRLAREELARARKLAESGIASELDLLRRSADAERQKADADALSFSVLRQTRDQKTRETRGLAELEEMRRELAALEGKRAIAEAAVRALRSDIERRTVRAPVSGRVEDALPLTVGAFVREGQKLGAIVPSGELRVVASFSPHEAVGRVRPGQRASLRFDGYPWTQFGQVPARVASVASETRDGLVKVELDPGPSEAFPLEHGMTATAIVEVDELSPAELALRALGAFVAPNGPAPREPPVGRR